MSALFRSSVASAVLRGPGRGWMYSAASRSISGRDIDTTNYGGVRTDVDKWVDQLRSHPDRYQRIEQREDRSSMSSETFIKHYTTGRYKQVYRGIPLMKSPEDMAVVYQLLWYLQPATIIEIGAFSGGPEMMSQLKHPMVVIEDAHMNVMPLLTYFHQFLQEGDYLVVEDCNPNTPTVSGAGSLYQDAEYVPWGPHKLEQLRSFLTSHNRWYSVDSFYTDFFGYNGTCNWHGIIRKMI